MYSLLYKLSSRIRIIVSLVGNQVFQSNQDLGSVLGANTVRLFINRRHVCTCVCVCELRFKILDM